MIKKTCSTLKMGLWNVGGLISKQFNKTTDPKFLRKNYNFDLLFLVETQRRGDALHTTRIYQVYIIDNRMFTIQFENGL